MKNSTFKWRGDFENNEVNSLHAEAFNHSLKSYDWRGQVERHSVGCTCARDGHELVGFVNVAWDGGIHAFILDAMVKTSHTHQGIAKRMIALAVDGATDAGCEWLHVDYTTELAPFYEACGFQPTTAGLIKL